MDTTDAVMDLAKRRGFLYPAFEVYGGMAGFYDYGPMGAAMKHRFESLWRHMFTTCAVPMAEVACPRVTMHEVLKASGHVDEFTDLVVKCKNGHPSRADHLIEAAGYPDNADALSAEAVDEQIGALDAKCPVCGDAGFTGAAPMNLMFNTEIGPGSGRTGFLRPETAQGIFTDFPHLLRHFRGKLPFGAVQLGGANRNEISPRQGMIRLREFHMAEAEVFFEDTDAPFAAFDDVAADEALFVSGTGEERRCSLREAVESGLVAHQALGYFIGLTQRFLLAAGMDAERLRFRQHEADEMAHYASDCWDAEFHSERYGWVECVGIADRGCYDLSQHVEATGKAGDFQVVQGLDEPYRFQARRIVPVMGVLGKTFKADAKRIAAAMEQVFDEQVQTLRDNGHKGFDAAWLDDELVITGPKDAAPGDGPLHLSVDGEEVEVPAEGYQTIDGEWQVTGRRLIPRVIEPSFGVDRVLYALWEHAYEKGEKNGEPYTVMHLSRHVAPVQVAVLPLTGKDSMPEQADAIERMLRGAGHLTEQDASGNIGRRYARQDEVGTPYCITIDNDTMTDRAVTVRDRDTTEQERVPVDDLLAWLAERFQRPGTPAAQAMLAG